MKYIKLTNSNLTVSRLCLGCMSFGDADKGDYAWTLNYDESKKIIDLAISSGINYFDTSNNYSNGTSEEYLGKAIKDYNRKDLVIETKCYFNEGKLSKEAIHREVKNSLQRLQTDYIDIYVLHRFDYDTPVEETLDALNEEVKLGHIHYYGVSAMYGYQFAEYLYLAKEKGYQNFTTLQNHYSLIYREDERDLIPIAKKFNVSLTPFSPFAAGRLTRKEWDSDSLRYSLDSKTGTRYDHMEEYDKKIAYRVYEMSQKYNCSMANVCLAWQYYKGIEAPIIGCTKEKHLLDALNATDIVLNKEDVDYLEELYVPHPIVANR